MSAFPTTALMAAQGMSAEDRAAIRSLIALQFSKRAVRDLEADVADLQATTPSCTRVSPEQLKELVLLASVAESLAAPSGGRRRHKQHGGGVTDAVKSVLSALCDAASRGVGFTTETTETALLDLSNRLRTASAAKIGQFMNRTLLTILTSAALYNLQYGTEGFVGSMVTAIVSALYEATPSVTMAGSMGVGAAVVTSTALAGVASAYTSTAVVTYTSSLIMASLRRAGKLVTMLPNPTDPQQIHAALQEIFSVISDQIKLGAFVFPRGRSAAAPADPLERPLRPGENELGRRANVLLLTDGALESAAADAVSDAGRLTNEALGTAIGKSAEEVAALRARNAARFGQGGRRRRRGTRKQHHRSRRHTRKH
jgi:hypothetical protein